ncbi:MAG: three-Cys-motif partner protein TcmP [Myxococcales bacterium]|nr:three-Cys-motif partner protein TcmP [Myxococcales bacterium]
MSLRRSQTTQGNVHAFGGDWTTTKLDVLARYLKSYTKALRDKPTKDNPFRKAYIDAFAGTGYRTARREDAQNQSGQFLLLPDLAGDEPQGLLDGSARLALKCDPPFDRYIFIERSPERCDQLAALRSEFPTLASAIDVRQGDANTEIQALCGRKPWRDHRAVLFLDPYGMQVEWDTIAAVAATKAIDMWLLFPLGIGVARLLTKTGDIPAPWRRRLNLLLGREDWYDEFYRIETSTNLFGEPEQQIVKATTETIGRYFNERLKSVFAAVAPEPRVLHNSSNCPLYLLCFAAGNERGAPIALKIANHLLRPGVQ